MTRFVPREKLGKKARRSLDKAKRRMFEEISPVTKTVDSKKLYTRKKPPLRIEDDGTGVFLSYVDCIGVRVRAGLDYAAFSSGGSL